MAYDRLTRRLEVRFKWHSTHQYWPVPLQSVGELWKARPVNTALSEMVKNNRGIRFDEVRSEGKLLMSMLRGLQLLSTR
jgi:KTSC domain